MGIKLAENSPQIENGYTKIANELLDALCKTKMPGTSRQIFNVILRKTYGFNRKKDSISRSEEHTSELQSHSFISYAVFCLKKKKI